jgi:hypothetical protein
MQFCAVENARWPKVARLRARNERRLGDLAGPASLDPPPIGGPPSLRNKLGGAKA